MKIKNKLLDDKSINNQVYKSIHRFNSKIRKKQPGISILTPFSLHW